MFALHEKIKDAVKQFGGKEALARELGISDRTVANYMNGSHEPKVSQLFKIAELCNKPISFFIGTETITTNTEEQPETELGKNFHNDIPIYGTAAGSLAGSISIKDNTISYVQRPDGLRRIPDAYALHVTGNSMSPRYNEREVIFVHPGKLVYQGDIVIIQQQNHNDAEITAFIKEFVSQSETHITVRQYNPDATIEFAKETVKAMHRVLTPNEYFGV